ncbi:MAG TPA: DUF475 domain-containing protein [Candidatus Saccharimonadales bacterium]|nr:DUF475 domain-containing protein [Candidatus Saccharimonadales bacterium]
MTHPLHPHSSVRIFAFSGAITVAALIGVLAGKGWGAMFVALILIVVEVAFSFDNAILNAKILSKMSRFWQNMFLTVGALIAIFGMRLVFPILIVAITAGIGWHEVLDLALHHPEQYAHELEKAHVSLSSFGGAFLLVLALDFFIDPSREVSWITRLEDSFQKLARHWAAPAITFGVVLLAAALPANHDKLETIVAGIAGIVVYSIIHGFTIMFGRAQEKRMKGATYVGLAAFTSFLYLEVLDATFSFDSVLGAFAVTEDVLLIALGLGVGAFWVRSLTIFMVRRKTLGNYVFIEHGAHYTIGILALILFVSIIVNVPEVITGLTGVGIIAASVIASRQVLQSKKAT